MNLKNKKVFITGAAGGIGTELCRIFCQKGARVYALDLNKNSLSDLKDLLATENLKIETHTLDVTKDSDYEALTRYLKNTTPDVWINNAGISFPKSFLDTDTKLYHKIIDVNLNGVIRGTRFALSLMAPKNTGTIVNMASVAGHVPAPFLSSYVASKHGVVGFTRSLQMELSQQHSAIKLLLVSPGFADTAIMKTNPDEFSIPKSMSWMISTAASVAKDIVKGIESDREEICPVASGRALLSLYKYAPKRIFNFITRLVSAENTEQMLGRKPIRAKQR